MYCTQAADWSIAVLGVFKHRQEISDVFFYVFCNLIQTLGKLTFEMLETLAYGSTFCYAFP